MEWGKTTRRMRRERRGVRKQKRTAQNDDRRRGRRNRQCRRKRTRGCRFGEGQCDGGRKRTALIRRELTHPIDRHTTAHHAADRLHPQSPQSLEEGRAVSPSRAPANYRFRRFAVRFSLRSGRRHIASAWPPAVALADAGRRVLSSSSPHRRPGRQQRRPASWRWPRRTRRAPGRRRRRPWQQRHRQRQRQRRLCPRTRRTPS